MTKAVVIGAGIGGISAALRLRNKGYTVHVFESNPYPGGKIHAIEMKGFRFDMGPSLFTMPHLIDQLFELFGKKPEDHFNYKRKSILCRYFWEDGTRFTAKDGSGEFAKEAADVFGVEESTILKYLNRNKSKFDLTATLFLEKSLHRWTSYLSTRTLRALFFLGRLDVFQTLDQVNRRSFSEQKLVQLFNRYATYNGSSPYSTPGIMSMIPHLEMFFGTFFPEGGMHQIVQSLYQLALEEGIEFHFNNKVDEILVADRKAKGIQVNGQKILADVVISNMDIYPTYRNLMPGQKAPERILAQERSTSALIFYWGISHTFNELDLHNIFFSEEYESEFEHLFKLKSLYEDPTIYVNITSKDCPSDAPENSENWFVMINAPGDYGQNWEELKNKARSYILKKLNRILKVNLEEFIQVEHCLDPSGIERNTSSYRGSLYGAASNSRYSAFLRHPNFSRKISDLYFCGGSVHPGGGIPLCLNSARIISDLIQ